MDTCICTMLMLVEDIKQAGKVEDYEASQGEVNG